MADAITYGDGSGRDATADITRVDKIQSAPKFPEELRLTTRGPGGDRIYRVVFYEEDAPYATAATPPPARPTVR